MFRLTVLLESRWFLLLDNISKERGFSLFFSIMPPVVLVYRAGRCWHGEGACCTGAEACPSLGWSSFASSVSVMDVGSQHSWFLFSELAKNSLRPCGGKAKSPPFPVTDNVRFWGAPDFGVLPCSREAANPFSCSSSLSSSPCSAFSKPFHLLFLAAQ